jgi:hypothetical protein
MGIQKTRYKFWLFFTAKLYLRTYENNYKNSEILTQKDMMNLLTERLLLKICILVVVVVVVV